MPGAPPSRAPYVVGAVAVLVVVGLVALLVALLTGDDDEPTRPPVAEPTTAAPSPTAPATTPGATCWDGSAAESVEACSAPTGAEGLAWVFPVLAEARCGQPSSADGDGVVTRVLCLYRLEDGTRAQLGFFEWASVDRAAAFYDGQGLARSESADFLTWDGRSGGQAKTATLYAAAPYSVTLTYPAGAGLDAAELAAFSPRPAAELRGTPAQ